MYRYRTFAAVFMKDDSVTMKPMSRVSDGLYDRLHVSSFVPTRDTVGEVLSPKFGPSAKWIEMKWQGHQPAVDSPSYAEVQLIGVDSKNKETVLRTFLPGQWNNDISDINAAAYPYLRLKMVTRNNRQAVPYQLDYWRLFYNPVADGALSALDKYVFQSPILITGKDNLHLELAYKNISKTWLEPASVRITIANRDGNQTVYDLNKLKGLNPADTAIIAFDLNTQAMNGRYYAYIQVNREQNPVEQNSFNNFTYIPFEVTSVLPVTLLDFTANPEKQAVRLDWKVTNEQEVSNYIAEHSASYSSNFIAIGSLPSKNLASANAAYTLLHQSPVEGANYYRIKTIYKNGKFEYSPVRQVSFSRLARVSIYPNPFSQQIFVSSPGTQKWLLEMFTAQGQKLMVKNGSGSMQVNTSNLPAGTYLVKLTTTEGISTMKFEKHR
jgi:hypothetical protein